MSLLGGLWRNFCYCLALTSLGNVCRVFLHHIYTADTYWESLEGAGFTLFFLIHPQKSETRGEKSQSGQKMRFRRQIHSFHGFTPVEISSRFVKFFFKPNRACR